MRIKSAYKYQLNELIKPVIIFYGIIIVLSVLFTVATKRWMLDGFVTGWEAASAIFLFVCGLNAFKAPFHMFMANGLSRKAMFTGTIAALATVVVGMAVIDGAIAFVLSLFMPYGSAFALQYAGWYGTSWLEGIRETAPMIFSGIVWRIATYMTVSLVGLFLTTAYYRMNKPVKLAVSIGVPVLLFIVWPIVDATALGGVLTHSVTKAIDWATSWVGKNNPYSSVLFNTVEILITGGLIWLLTRRATVKTQ